MRSEAARIPVRGSLTIKKQLVFTLIIVFGFLMIGELGVRAWAYYFRTSYERFNWETSRLELVPNIRKVESNGEEFLINAKGFVGEEFDAIPSEGTYRIISLGDSCTFTLGHWKRAYPYLLQGFLNGAGLSQRFEVINAGIEGYNSTYALARLEEEFAQYRPDHITIYVGWNDLMKENPEGLLSGTHNSFIGKVFEKSYLVKAYKKMLFFYLRPLFFKPNTDPAVNQQELHYYDEYVPAIYQSNLESMLMFLKDKKIGATLFTLPTVVSLEMGYDQLKKQNVMFPYYAGSFSVGKFLSLHAAYNNVIRKVGKKYGVSVVDLDKVFNAYDKNEHFWDTMHPNEKGNFVIARAVFDHFLESRTVRSIEARRDAAHTFVSTSQN